MKKIILLMLLLGLALPAQAKTLNVLTTTTDLKSVVEFVGKDKVKVFSLGDGDQNYHFLSAKPSYMVKAKKADLFIRVGLDLEIGYESLILEGSRNPDIRVGRQGHLDASEGITPRDVPDEVDRSMGDIHAGGNPHYWLDPLNMKIVASSIASRLSEISPENKSVFAKNLINFHSRIDRKMAEWKKALAPYTGEKLITYHKTWKYFAERFSFEIIGELEQKPGVPPSPSHLKNVIGMVKENNVKIILNENIYTNAAAQYVAQRTGAVVINTPISVGGAKGTDDYFSLMDKIVQDVAGGFQL